MIAIDVTNKCNMNCEHCYASTFKHIPEVEINEFKTFCDEAYQLGASHYILQGGEAILDFERLKKLIPLLYPQESYINVMSNGWEMDIEMIRKLKNLDVDKIGLSLDSGFAKEHDANRMPGAYDRVITAIKNIKSEGLHSSISTVVTRGSLQNANFKKILEIASKLDVRVDVQVAMPVGKWEGKKDIRITPDEAKFLKNIYISKGLLPSGRRHIGRDIYKFSEKDRCIAGKYFMAVTASGEILPCNFCQYTLGNIKDTSLIQARQDLMTSKWFQGTHPRCLLGEDDDFFDQYVTPNIAKEKPLDAYELFSLERTND
ncbi:radical SAM/SPASM domain-containing protein [Maridesulfovibrio frigidus]|uniref:radical SAM/SPASM domain-containing protein n=1 Tax=Maridesulfovibrio frigidus TaxID=340956 RepID=UPI0004E1B32A|nr:radical SAM protein [Maridesulfovibrio frigidus]